MPINQAEELLRMLQTHNRTNWETYRRETKRPKLQKFIESQWKRDKILNSASEFQEFPL